MTLSVAHVMMSKGCALADDALWLDGGWECSCGVSCCLMWCDATAAMLIACWRYSRCVLAGKPETAIGDSISVAASLPPARHYHKHHNDTVNANLPLSAPALSSHTNVLHTHTHDPWPYRVQSWPIASTTHLYYFYHTTDFHSPLVHFANSLTHWPIYSVDLCMRESECDVSNTWQVIEHFASFYLCAVVVTASSSPRTIRQHCPGVALFPLIGLEHPALWTQFICWPSWFVWWGPLNGSTVIV